MSKTLDKVIALAASDLHLSHNPPLIRCVYESAEKNKRLWYRTQADILKNLEDIRQSCNSKHGLHTPLIVAGDITNSWYEPPEFINFLLTYFPELYAIPGQHDLPRHNIGEIRKSVYWTLVKTRKIIPIDCDPKRPTQIAIDGKFNKLLLYGFPHGLKLRPCKKLKATVDGQIKLAVIHKYIWINGHQYKDAPDVNRLKHFLPKLKGYTAALFGDNHNGFLYKGKQLDILNPGCLLRRRADEINYQPMIGLLHESGRFSTQKLSIKMEKIIDPRDDTAKVIRDLNLDAYIEDLESLDDKTVDVHDSVRRWLEANKVTKDVKRHILKLLEQRKTK